MTKPSRPKIQVATDGPSWIATYRDPSRTWALQDAAGTPCATTEIDGYGVGDRLLEGVMFRVALLSDGAGFTVTSRPEDHTYLKALAMKAWMRRLAEYAANDLDDEDIGWRPAPNATVRTTPAPREIPLVSVAALGLPWPPKPMRRPVR